MAEGTLSACLAEIKASPVKFYVYLMSRPDGRPFYVGKGHGRRISQHESHARGKARGIRLSVIRKIWRAGGAVSYRIVSFHEHEADAFAAEMALIAEIRRRQNGGPLVNRTDGGDGVTGFRQVLSSGARAKISAAHKGVPKSPEHAAKVGAANRGKKRPPEFSEKMSAILRTPEVMARMVGNRAGYKPTAETKAKIAAAKRGHKQSPETVAKRAASLRGKKRTPEVRAKLSAAAFRRPPVSEEEKVRLRDMRHAQPPISDETKRKQSEKMKAIRAEKKWGVSEAQRRQIAETLRAYNAKLKSKS